MSNKTPASPSTLYSPRKLQSRTASFSLFSGSFFGRQKFDDDIQQQLQACKAVSDHYKLALEGTKEFIKHNTEIYEAEGLLANYFDLLAKSKSKSKDLCELAEEFSDRLQKVSNLRKLMNDKIEKEYIDKVKLLQSDNNLKNMKSRENLLAELEYQHELQQNIYLDVAKSFVNAYLHYFDTGAVIFRSMEEQLKKIEQMEKKMPKRKVISKKKSFSDMSRFVKSNNTKVFGVPLKVFVKKYGTAIPKGIEELITYIEAKALEKEGIFRVPGQKSDMGRIREMLDAGKTNITEGDYVNKDHTICGVIKEFVRDLPEPLLTFELFDDFIEAAKIDDPEKSVKRLKDLVSKLPDENFVLLDRLMITFDKVLQHTEKNLMEPYSLAIVFGMNLLKMKKEDPVQMATLIPHINKVCELMIAYRKTIFPLKGEIVKETQTTNVEVFTPPKKYNIGKVIGVSIGEIAQKNSGNPVPPLIEDIMKEIEEKGLTSEFIFRDLGSQQDLKKLIQALNAGDPSILQGTIEKRYYTFAQVIKHFLENLTEPLLTSKLFDDFIAASKLVESERTKKFKELVQSLPQHNQLLLKRVVGLFKAIVNSPATKMQALDIALVFGQIFLRCEDMKDPRMASSMNINKVCELIIKYSREIFQPSLNLELQKDDDSPLPSPNGTVQTIVPDTREKNTVMSRPNNSKKVVTKGPTKIFGVKLQEISSRESEKSPVPTVIDELITYLEHEALEVEGLFSVQGDQKEIARLKESIDAGYRNVHDQEITNSVHTIAGLIILFLRELPEPLLTFGKYNDFVKAAKMPKDKKQVEKLAKLVSELPYENQAVLRRLITILRGLSESKQALMDATSIAKVFGTLILRKKSLDPQKLAKIAPDVNQVCEALIVNAREVFPGIPILKPKQTNEPPKPLPPGWQVFFDYKSQKHYYYNAATQETTWKHPALP